MAISTNGTIITRLAGALYGEYLSNASYTELASTPPATAAANFMTNDFSGKTDLQVANTILTNLGLTSITGLNNWLSAQLTAAGTTATAKGAALVSILNGYAGMTADATYGAYAVGFNAKVDAALTLSQTIGAKGGAFATADVVAVSNANFTLTTGLDTGALFTGGAGNDTFNAGYTAANGMTFQGTDDLNGGAGTDVLNISVGAVGTHQANSMANIETVSANFSAAGTVSLLGATGITKVVVTGSTVNSMFTNISSTATALEISNIGTVGGSDVTFGFTAAAVAGTADSATLTLKNVLQVATDGVDVITIAGIETLNIVSSTGPNTINTLTAANATTINISGDQTLNLGAANTVATTINATAATAAVTLIATNAAAVTVTGGSGNDAITITDAGVNNNVSGGAGNDTITFNANLTNADTVGGGDGTDTLVGISANLVALTVPTTATITGFETVTVSDSLGNNLTTANIQAGIAAVNLAATLAASRTITMEAGSRTVSQAVAATAGVTLTLTDTGTATTDSMTLTNRLATGDVFLAQIIAANGYETLNINTSTTGAAVTQTFGTISVTPDTGGAVAINFTGNNSVTTGIITATSATSGVVDASGLTGTRTFTNVGQTVGITSITGTANADTLVGSATATTLIGGGGIDNITGGVAADNISGGDGNDVITGAGGNDVITGGAGDDAITATVAGNVNIDGGTGNDTIDLGDTLTQADTINGGDGTDSITLTNTGVTNINALSITNVNTLNANMSNIESVTFTALAQAIDMGRIDGISTVTLGGGLGAGSTVSGLAATNSITINASTGNTLALDLANATGTADTLTLALAAGASVNANTITAAGIETVALTATDTDTTTPDAAHSLVLTAAAATTVTVAGNAASLGLTLTGTTVMTTLNASTFTGALTATSLSTAASTITGGTGADVLTGGTGADSINGGAGSDTLAGGTGADVIDGGTGNNTFAAVASGTATVEGAGTGTTEGMAINLGTTAVTAGTINTAMTGTIGLSGASTSLAAGSTQYIFATQSNFFATTADTLTNIQNITGTAGADYIVGSTVNNVITAGGGIDQIILGSATVGGSDTVKISAAALLGIDRDIISGFTAGAVTTTGQADVFNFNSGVATLTGTNNFAAAASLETSAATGGLTVAVGTEVLRLTGGTIAATNLTGTELIAVSGAITGAIVGQNDFLIAIGIAGGGTAIYYATSANNAIIAAEISLVGVLSGVAVADLVFSNFSNAA